MADGKDEMYKTVTFKIVESFNPCIEAMGWAKKKYKPDTEIKSDLLIKAMMKAKKYDWANWLIARLMDKPQYVAYAIFAAEQVIDIYEKKYPNDDRPRKAIEAAKEYLKNPSDENKSVMDAAADAATCAAAYAADAATCAAARTAAYAAYAAYAANAAARTAAYAAYATCAAARTATCAAAYAAYATDAAARTAIKKLQIKILNYGLKLMEGGS